MFTFPHTTTAFLLKDPIDMRYGMFRLQGVIADMLQRPMPKDSFYFFINRSHTLAEKASGLMARDNAFSASALKKVTSAGRNLPWRRMRNGFNSTPVRSLFCWMESS